MRRATRYLATSSKKVGRGAVERSPSSLSAAASASTSSAGVRRPRVAVADDFPGPRTSLATTRRTRRPREAELGHELLERLPLRPARARRAVLIVVATPSKPVGFQGSRHDAAVCDDRVERALPALKGGPLNHQAHARVPGEAAVPPAREPRRLYADRAIGTSLCPVGHTASHRVA
jgi:hypothetical protein